MKPQGYILIATKPNGYRYHLCSRTKDTFGRNSNPWESCKGPSRPRVFSSLSHLKQSAGYQRCPLKDADLYAVPVKLCEQPDITHLTTTKR